MSGVHPLVAGHRLSIDPSKKPIKQKNSSISSIIACHHPQRVGEFVKSNFYWGSDVL